MRAFTNFDFINYVEGTKKLTKNNVDIIELIVQTLVQSNVGTFANVDIEGGYIDSAVIGSFVPCTTVKAENFEVITGGTSKALLSALGNYGLFALSRDGAGTIVSLSAASGAVGILNMASMVFGGSSFTSPAVNYEFKGTGRFTGIVYADSDIVARYASAPYQVGLALSQFYAMDTATWDNLALLTPAESLQLTNIGSNVISNARWGFLTTMQNVAVGQPVTFGNIGCGDISAGNIAGVDVFVDTVTALTGTLGSLVYSGGMDSTAIATEIDLSPFGFGSEAFAKFLVKKVDPTYIHGTKTGGGAYSFSARSLREYQIYANIFTWTDSNISYDIPLSSLGIEYVDGDDEFFMCELWGRSYNRGDETPATPSPPKFLKLIYDFQRPLTVMAPALSAVRYAVTNAAFQNGGWMYHGSLPGTNVLTFAVSQLSTGLDLKILQSALSPGTTGMRLTIQGKILLMDS